MNLDKSFEFFDPGMMKGRVHIIGCGSVGSTVAELLARFGITDFTLYDFDFVEPHNIVNQMFTSEDVNRPKVEALRDILVRINPEIAQRIKLEPEGYKNQRLSGYVVLAVDSINLRRKIAEQHKANPFIKCMLDFRTGLTDAQHYAADWNDPKSKENFLKTMAFSDEDVQQTLSACNVELCVAPTVRLVCTVGVTNFINFIKGEKLHASIPIDAFNFQVDPIG